MQMSTVNVQGVGKDTSTFRSYHVIRQGDTHISFTQSILEIHSADAIKSELEPVQEMRIQFRSDPIGVGTGLNT